MSFVAIAISAVAVGAGLSAYGSLYAGQAQANSLKFNAAVERNNAGAAEQQGKFDAQQIADRTRRQVAIQRAAMSASGFDANTGSFSDVTSDTKRAGEMDRLSRVYMGRLGINRSLSQASLDTASAGYAVTGSYIGASATLIGGVGQGASIAANPSFQN